MECGSDSRYESIIFLSDKRYLNSALELCDTLVQAGKKVLILADDNCDVAAKKYSIRRFEYYYDIFPKDYSTLRQDASALFDLLAEEEIYDGATLRELTKYNGVSLLDLSAKYIFSKLLPVLYYFNMLEAIVGFEKPSEAHIINGTSNSEKIFELICEKKQLPSFIHKTPCRQKNACLKRCLKGAFAYVKQLKRFIVSLRCLLKNLLKFGRLTGDIKLYFSLRLKGILIQYYL